MVSVARLYDTAADASFCCAKLPGSDPGNHWAVSPRRRTGRAALGFQWLVGSDLYTHYGLCGHNEVLGRDGLCEVADDA